MACRLIQLCVRQPAVFQQRELKSIFLSGCHSYARHMAYASKIEQIFNNTRITQRGMFVDPYLMKRSSEDAYSHIESVTQRARRDMVSLASIAMRKTLNDSGLDAKEIKHVITVSEFPSCPPVDSELCHLAGLSNDVLRTPLIGFGCAATPIGFGAAMRYLEANPKEAVIVNSMECSSRVWATQFPTLLRRLLQREERHFMGGAEDSLQDGEEPLAKQIIGNIVIGALMGDGVASALLVGRHHRLAQTTSWHCVAGGPWLHMSKRQLFPSGQLLVGSSIDSCGTRMFLSTEIPRFVKAHAPSLIRSFCESSLIKHYFLHPGGPKVLECMQQELNIPNALIQHSYNSLDQLGNSMSLSLFDVIGRYSRVPLPNESGLIFGVGPGMTLELIRLMWH